MICALDSKCCMWVSITVHTLNEPLSSRVKIRRPYRIGATLTFVMDLVGWAKLCELPESRRTVTVLRLTVLVVRGPDDPMSA